MVLVIIRALICYVNPKTVPSTQQEASCQGTVRGCPATTPSGTMTDMVSGLAYGATLERQHG